MRTWMLVVLTACAAETKPPDIKPPLETVWADTIAGGDLIVAVAGTGAHSGTGAPIEASVMRGEPVVDARNISFNPIVLEQAIAAAQRAGFAKDEIESGAVTMGLWGAGIDVSKVPRFTYGSLGGLRVPFVVLGGRNAVADGELTDNLLNYNDGNANTDARDLYAKTNAWLAANPAQRVVIVAHSWGGGVAEYLATELAKIRADAGALAGGAELAFVAAAGVPSFIPGYRFLGPGFRTVPSGVRVYEVDRPDDMVHNLNPSGNIEGHQYDIMWGDEFRGSYGITTDDLSCHGVPGPCS